MAKSKKDKKRRKEALLAKEDGEAQAESKSNGTTPALRTPEETPALRTPEETPALRALEEDASRLSASSEESVLDTSLSLQKARRQQPP